METGSEPRDQDHPDAGWTPQDRALFGVLIIGVLVLLGGFVFKARCLPPEMWDGKQFRDLCYNDIQPLYGTERLFTADDLAADDLSSPRFPYIDGALADGELTGGAIEYAVLTGIFMWFSALFVSDFGTYLRVSSFFLAPFGVLASYWLAKLAGWRALMWAAAPAIVLYAFHNWDLLVVAAAVAGLWAWARGRPLWAAVAFAIGASLKSYPALFVIPLVLERLFHKDRKGAAGVAGAAAGTFAAVNLPFALVNFEGWWATYEFHRARVQNWDSIWSWLPFDITLNAAQINRWSVLLMVATFVAVVIVGWLRARTEGRYPFLQVAAALLAGFLLWNKVHSPQYTLWILPFFVLVRVHWAWWVAYAVVDISVYVGVFRWFWDFGAIGQIEVMTPFKALMIAGVWARWALLLVLVPLFLRARTALVPGAAAVESHPSSKVATVGGPQPEGRC